MTTFYQRNKKLIGIVALIVSNACIIVASTFSMRNSMRNSIRLPYVEEMYHRQCELKYYAAKEALVAEVDSFIHSKAPSSTLNALALVEACDEYEVDIKFALAQGLRESHFGTKGVAAKTNSVWNVLAYDGRSAEDMNRKGHGYKHPDESIEPYLKLLRNNYLVKGRTEQDLLVNFVNGSGKRYASDPNYESNMRRDYCAVVEGTDINELYLEYKHYKIISEK